MGSLSTMWSSRARTQVTGLKPTNSWTELDHLATQAGWEAQTYTPDPWHREKGSHSLKSYL